VPEAATQGWGDLWGGCWGCVDSGGDGLTWRIEVYGSGEQTQ
jgi:hypothetical protein